MQQVDIAAARRDDQHAERERDQIEGGEAASSRSRVKRATRPAASATARPATKPPRLMAKSDSRRAEADRRARQDGVAHGVAHQAHAPEHQEHADRRRAERQREAADQRAAHEGEFDEGLDESVDHAGCRSLRVISRADSACSSQASRAGAAWQVCRRQHLARVAPGHDLAREQERCREMRAHLLEVVQRGETVRPSPCQRSISAMRSAMVLASMAGNGSSSRMSGASCNRRRAKSTRWNWPPESAPIGRSARAEQSDRVQRLGDAPLCAVRRCRARCRSRATAPWQRSRTPRSGKLRSMSVCCGR